MSQISARPSTQQPIIAVIRVGYGVIKRGDPIDDELHAHLGTLEKLFGMPFYLQYFSYMSESIPDLRPEHKGEYYYTGMPNKKYNDLVDAILKWIRDESHYAYDYGISLLIEG